MTADPGGDVEESDTYSLLVGVQTGIATLEINLQFKAQNRSGPWSSFAYFKMMLYATLEVPDIPTHLCLLMFYLQ